MPKKEEGKAASWRTPSGHKIKAMKCQKRALQSRLFDCGSPAKKLRHGSPHKVTLPTLIANSTTSAIQPPSPADNSCDEDDSTLMDLLGLRLIPGENIPTSVLNFSMLLSSPTKTNIPIHHSPVKVVAPPSPPPAQPTPDSSMSPLKGFNPDIEEGISSPSKDNRKTLVPTPLPLSQSFSPKSKKVERKRRLNDLPRPSEGGPDWNAKLCLDWSLKTSLAIITPNSYGWSSNNLKTSEESSGISSFVRCIDIEPSDSFHPSCRSIGNSQLDTSLGAQFHQCCLYWQHPSIPSISLFPREVQLNNGLNAGQKSTVNNRAPIRFEKSMVDSMHLEWIEAFRSAFQLLKARQCPFFYVCMNSFTCLFCSAGTQGDEQMQIYITPTTRQFRHALTAEKISFNMPCASVRKRNSSTGSDNDEIESDDEVAPNKSMNAMRISQKSSPTADNTDVNASLVFISGTDTFTFFNFLIKSKTMLIANGGPFAGFPPTLFAPVAFHGAMLKTLKVEQRKIIVDGIGLHSIDMKGPILPHILHMLTSLLNKTVKNYKIRLKTLESTIPLNLYSNVNQIQERIKGSAFDMQNLSDCGLKKGILEVFCKCDNCDTIMEMLEGRRGMYRWY